MIDEKKLIDELSKNSILEKITVGDKNVFEIIEQQPKVDVPDTNVGKWIPFKTRETDEDEQLEYGFTHMMDCKLPEEDEEILVTYSSGYVGTDVFLREGFECYLDSGREFVTEAIAWMPLPEPYNPTPKVPESWKESVMQSFMKGE